MVRKVKNLLVPTSPVQNNNSKKEVEVLKAEVLRLKEEIE